MGFFERIKLGLSKTRTSVFTRVFTLFKKGKLDKETLDELEETLIGGDMGVKTTRHILSELETRAKSIKELNQDSILDELKSILLKMLQTDHAEEVPAKPKVLLVVGVNGVGKTTTIGKLCKLYQEKGQTVILAAADTFRAAAIDQLQIWAERNKVELIRHKDGADPSAVAFDAVQASIAREKDICLIDTAGRLHNKDHLMDQLSKMVKAIQKLIPDAPHEIMLVLDATMGQNAVQQAKVFHQLLNIDSIVLTKLDGTAKGGVIFSIYHDLQIPVKYIGIGEGIDDLNLFDPIEFIDALFENALEEIG